MLRVLPTDTEHGWYLDIHPREYTDNAADNKRHRDFFIKETQSHHNQIVEIQLHYDGALPDSFVTFSNDLVDMSPTGAHKATSSKRSFFLR